MANPIVKVTRNSKVVFVDTLDKAIEKYGNCIEGCEICTKLELNRLKSAKGDISILDKSESNRFVLGKIWR